VIANSTNVNTEYKGKWHKKNVQHETASLAIVPETSRNIVHDTQQGVRGSEQEVMEICRQARSQLASQEGDVGSQEGVLVEVSTNGGHACPSEDLPSNDGPVYSSEDLPSKIDRMEMSVTRTSPRKNPIACLVSRKEHHVCDEIIIDHQGTAQVQPQEGMTLRSGRVLQDSKVASKNGATTIKSLSLLDVETE
jgi:hypothetical protein